MTANDIAAFTAVVEDVFGFHGAGLLEDEMERLLAARLAATTARDVDAYRALLSSSATRRLEVVALAERLCVGETYFFRDAVQLDAFAHVALPARLAEAGRPVRVASIGCSSGEEAYSIAITAREALGPRAEHVSIVGRDIHAGAIDRARLARYSKWALRATPSDLRQHYFRSVVHGYEGYELVDDLRRDVTFEVANLFDDDPAIWPQGAFDIVFCRNVLIYFSPRRVAEAVRRLAHIVAPGGFLFLGHCELSVDTPGFDAMRCGSTYYHVRRDLRPVAARSYSALRAQATPYPVELPPPRPAEDVAIACALERATDLFRAERFADALAALDELPVSCRDRRVRLLRAAILANQSRLNDAEAVCRALLDDAPDQPGALYLLAMCAMARGDIDVAIAQHRRAIALDRGFAMSHLQLGILARRRGEVGAPALFRAALAALEGPSDASLALLSGGFSQTALADLCRSELRACGAA